MIRDVSSDRDPGDRRSPAAARPAPGRTVSGEFTMLDENAMEAGFSGPLPQVRRVGATLPDGRHVSALAWGETEPEVVLFHGGAQNAHTWDTVLMGLGRPALAVDLPGHGLSDWRADHDYSPWSLAEDVAAAVRALAPAPRLVVGMSLGGLTAWAVGSRHPDLVPGLVVIDITPGVTAEGARAIVSFTRGPETFASREEILDRTVAHNPTRTLASLRRGVIHNTVQQADGRWRWRWDPERAWTAEEGLDLHPLWQDVAACTMPQWFVRGGDSPVVTDADEAQVRQTATRVRTTLVGGAGHSIQGDKPMELVGLLNNALGGN